MKVDKMKKGFTLIELLAVIVILAIIALIATPIIINIIENSRGESEKRSIELYASAIKNAIASYQLTHPNAPTSIDDLKVEYNGDVKCDIVEIYEDGNVYLSNCKVNDNLVEGYTYGTKQYIQVYKPQYYSSCSGGGIGDNLPRDATRNLSELDKNNKPYYLKLESEDGETVSAAYVCFTTGEPAVEYCIQGGDAGTAFSANQGKLETALPGACSDDGVTYSCIADGLHANASSRGYVNAGAGNVDCYVDAYGTFACYGY